MEVEEECDFYNGSDDELSNYSSADSPKLQFRNDKCTALWIEGLRMARVTENKGKGKLWTTTGITCVGETYFFIEEIVYLFEIGALELLSDGMVLKLSDIYGKRYIWESVDVYRHLKSLGYIVGRHGISLSLKKSDTKLGDVENGRSDDKGMVDESLVTEMLGNLHIWESTPIYDVYLPNSKFKKSAPGSPLFLLFLVSGQPPSNQEIKHLEACYSGSPLKFCTVDHGRVTFLSYTKVELPVPP